jgi:hypothetical protein
MSIYGRIPDAGIHGSYQSPVISPPALGESTTRPEAAAEATEPAPAAVAAK